MIKVYPTQPIGAARVPGVPAIEHEVSEERAAELMAFMPPAFTTNEDGSPTEDQLEAEKAAYEGAWALPADSIQPASEDMSVPELRAQAKARGLSAAGKKADLIDRIQEHDAVSGESEE